MENNQEREDLSKIRHYKGTVKDFKDYWDEMAGQDTNATGTPAYQDFNGVHPAGKARQSEHWKTSNIIESKRLSFKDAQITDTMDLSNAMDSLKDAGIDWNQKGQAFVFNSTKEQESARKVLGLN
jgi:hypothetical protein|tara:strand:+ start:882 stop:1256 length:375 start_codon:yes stop_codon:yes gene_type:complete